MTTTYNYFLPFNKNLVFILSFFIIITIVGLSIPFSIDTRKYHFNNHTLFYGGLVITLLFAIVTIVLYMKSMKSMKNSQPIALEEIQLVFPVGASQIIVAEYKSIGSIKEIGNKMNGAITEVKSSDGSFKTLYIQGKGFESVQVYQEFLEKLRKLSVNK